MLTPDRSSSNNLKRVFGQPHVQKLEEKFPSDFENPITKEDLAEYLDLMLDDVDETDLDLSKEEFTLTELLTIKNTEYPFLVENLIPEKAIAFISGDSDAGKTLLYTQLSTAIIEGKSEFLGLKLKTHFQRVLVLNSEDSPIAFTIRAKLQLNGRILSKSVTDKFRLMTNGADSVKKIMQRLEITPVDLVVIDAFADVFEGDLNSANDVRKFIQSYGDLINTFGCSVLFVHHNGKAGEKKEANKTHMLGSVGIHGKPRQVINLAKSPSDPNIKYLKITKGNYVSEENKKKIMVLKFDPKTLLHEVANEEIIKEEQTAIEMQPKLKPTSGIRTKTELLMQQAYKMSIEENLSIEEIGVKLGKSKDSIYRYLKDYKALYDNSRILPKKTES